MSTNHQINSQLFELQGHSEDNEVIIDDSISVTVDEPEDNLINIGEVVGDAVQQELFSSSLNDEMATAIVDEPALNLDTELGDDDEQLSILAGPGGGLLDVHVPHVLDMSLYFGQKNVRIWTNGIRVPYSNPTVGSDQGPNTSDFDFSHSSSSSSSQWLTSSTGNQICVERVSSLLMGDDETSINGSSKRQKQEKYPPPKSHNDRLEALALMQVTQNNMVLLGLKSLHKKDIFLRCMAEFMTKCGISTSTTPISVSYATPR